MFKNCFYDTRNSEMHLWEQIKGEDLETVIPWTPYVYMPSKKSKIKTIFGKSVYKREFNTYFDYHKYQKERNTSHLYENRVRFEIQFLTERYHGIPDEEIAVPKLLVYYLDIEVHAPAGFPDPKDAADIVTLVSIRNSKTNQTTTFGYNPAMTHFADTSSIYEAEGVDYYHCDTEEELLRKFYEWIGENPCDVISGWNIWAFDLPYLINRAVNIFGGQEGKRMYRNLSRNGVVNIWKQKMSDEINIDMGGVAILDYYNVYKWYGSKRERYTLEYISQCELGEGKLDYSKYKNLTELMRMDWDLYVDYNVVDCERVHDLENKLGYIRMVQGLSLLCKSPMKYYNAQTQLIEGLMLTYYRRNNLCAPHFFGGDQEHFRAAYVKEPDVGLHEWVVDVDITSSYPSHIITLNMSLETFVGKVMGDLSELEIIKSVGRRRFNDFNMLKEDPGDSPGKADWKTVKMTGDKLVKFNTALDRGLIAIAPNGAIFSTKKLGVVAEVEKNVFFKRKEVKGMQKKHGHLANETEGAEQKEHKEREKEYNSLQLALKIMMNAFFGILSVPYSRYFNVHIAEAITFGGRNTILRGQSFCNDLLNYPNSDLLGLFPNLERKHNGEEKDYVKYIDTDSLFVGLGEWINDQGYGDFWYTLPKTEKIEWIKKISGVMEKYIDKRIFKEVQIGDYNSQVHDFKIGFKQEIIAQTALFVKKKKYSYYLVDKEGVAKDELSTTGLEIVRSDSPEAIRPRLKKIMEMIIKQESDESIAAQIRKYRKELSNMSPADLAANVGINNIRKYIRKDDKSFNIGTEEEAKPKKGTPWHVRGVHNYRKLLEYLDIQHKYEDIYEGNKAKVIYVKKNPFEVDMITFQEWPEEFDNLIQYDYDTMIEKFFINKIRTLLAAMDKEHIVDSDDTRLGVFF